MLDASRHYFRKAADALELPKSSATSCSRRFVSSRWSSVTLPDDLSTPYGVMLFYRGHW